MATMTASPPPAPAPSVGGVTRWARYGVILFAWLFAAGVVLQVFLAGLSLFGSATHWDDHEMSGHIVIMLTYFVPIFALIGRIGVKLILLSFLLLVLAEMQYAFANAGSEYMGALHPVNALILFWFSIWIGRQVLQLLRHQPQSA